MLYLASQSPRRRQLLDQLGLEFRLLDVDVEEVRGHAEAADDYVRRVAREKAGAGLLEVVAVPAALVLGADTEVVLDGEVFGKPRDQAHAAEMLRRLSGRTHQVLSSVAVVGAAREAQATVVSEVEFAELPDAAIERYVATGEPMGKAGAYAIQGRGEAFIRHLSGSYSAVMGLPLHATCELLQQFGIQALGGDESAASAHRPPRPAHGTRA